MTEDLAQMSCEECPVDTPKMDLTEITVQHKQIPSWSVARCDGILQLEREYPFHNFSVALAFTNFIGVLAERERHYPAIVTEWGNVRVNWWTRHIGGLHRNDFIMAAKTDVAYDAFVHERVLDGEMQILQHILLSFVKVCFPELTGFARKQANLCNSSAVLEKIAKQVFDAPNEKSAQQLLKSLSD